MTGDMRAGCDETIADLEASLSCPRCRAESLLAATSPGGSDYQRGLRLACIEAKSHPHECNP